MQKYYKKLNNNVSACVFAAVTFGARVELMFIVCSVCGCWLPPYILTRTGYQENNHFSLLLCN